MKEYKINLDVERKSLFNEYYAYNEEANELSLAFDKTVSKLFTDYCGDKGYSPRELAEILHQCIENNMSTWVIMYAMEKHKANKSKIVEQSTRKRLNEIRENKN